MVWKPSNSDLKTYRHFDAVISLDQVIEYVSDPETVSQHSFMPLLHFVKKWRRAPLKRKGQPPLKRKPKERPIRYAARKDAYIFKFYREILSERYELKLHKSGLQDCVLAYRRIPKKIGPGHKSNIEFAEDAFDAVDKMGKCCAVAIDISDFFGSMSHEGIKETWKSLLDKDHLPADHYAVFRALTKFRFVDRDRAYEALGYSEKQADGAYKYLIPPVEIPHQICTNEQFRERIVDNDLVCRNEGEYENRGVPQGAPLSDLIANAYLIAFDLEMRRYAQERSGIYFRYSDDILFVLPGDGRAGRAAYRFAEKKIQEAGEFLVIKPEKTEITCYTKSDAKRRCHALAFDKDTKRLVRAAENQGLSYLGFRYDGQKIYLRNSTVSNLRGKIFRSCKATAINHVDRHMDKDINWLLENAPLEILLKKFFQVEDFVETVEQAEECGQSPFSKMTFFSYAERASKSLGDRGGTSDETNHED